MLSPLRSASLVGLMVLASTTSANYIAEKLSFGHYHPVSHDGKTIPDWHTEAEKHSLQFLSDRIILTPPYPGNARGALWSDLHVDDDQWTAELTFRASGQEQGSGNLQIWYVADKSKVGTKSAYTVEQFDGLVVLIDQYGHTGKLRAFLNDGSVNFRSHGSIESLTFGSCDFAYRNQGRPSKVKMELKNGLTVWVDDRECFRTDRVRLPKENFFGITAGTSDNPDSFEVNKFIVTKPTPDERVQYVPPTPQQQGQDKPLQKLDRFPGSPEALPDRDAGEIKSHNDQFADLHNRLQGLTHQFFNVFMELETISKKLDDQHTEVIGTVPPAIPRDMVERMNSRLESMEKTLTRVELITERHDYEAQLKELKRTVDSMKASLSGDLPETLGHFINSSAPRMHNFVGVIVAVQILLAVAYIAYKRRRNSMPKKYL